MEATRARVLSGVRMCWRRLYLLALASLFFAPGPGAAAERVSDPIQVRIDCHYVGGRRKGHRRHHR